MGGPAEAGGAAQIARANAHYARNEQTGPTKTDLSSPASTSILAARCRAPLGRPHAKPAIAAGA
eukprot:3163528-Lingulodinium_polyedra.AAC.1